MGVAPEATIIPMAINLTNDQNEDQQAEQTIKWAIENLFIGDRDALDASFAAARQADLANYDIINGSYGSPLGDYWGIADERIDEIDWYRAYLPKYLDAVLQTDTPDRDKTIHVYATGNDGYQWPTFPADYPYYLPEIRGVHLAVAATDPETRSIASYSNRCGPLPEDWSRERDGPHYCLAAPGTVTALAPQVSSPGRGELQPGITGTSFAAPVVSGALALLMEHFRGTRGHTEVVRRMLDTADRSGAYADSAIYGAGHLDLQAALSPVGAVHLGASREPLHRTRLQASSAFGDLGARMADIEVAGFDDQGFPFWTPLSALVTTTRAGAGSSTPIPEFSRHDERHAPATGLDGLDLRWSSFGDREGSAETRGRASGQWTLGLGESSAAIVHALPETGWGYGLGYEGASHLGARTAGAFGAHASSGLGWVSRSTRHALGERFGIDTETTLAVAIPQYQRDAIFDASASLLTAFAVRIGTPDTGLTVSQPLRAESGTAHLRVETGEMDAAARLYDDHTVTLVPNARELRVSLRHDQPAARGDIALEVSHAFDAGHVSGARDARVGIAYRMRW